MFKTTQQHTQYWANRQIDWQQSYFNLDHPHRDFMIDLIRISQLQFGSVLEVGCASGANLYRLLKAFPWLKQENVGGVDVNEAAITQAQKNLPDAWFFKNPAHDMFLSDKSSDLGISDMCLLYYSPLMIRKALREMLRVTRLNLVLCELHHENPAKRLKLRLQTGYNAYNYVVLLEELGCYTVDVYKIPEQVWPGGNPQKDFGHIIIARL